MKKERRPLKARFLSKVDYPDANGCWPWLGAKDGRGYGQIRDRRGGPLRPAHRVAYQLLRGLIPAGLTIDHLCRNKGCVNPAHMEPVTQAENVRRGTPYHKKRHGPVPGVTFRRRMDAVCAAALEAYRLAASKEAPDA